MHYLLIAGTTALPFVQEAGDIGGESTLGTIILYIVIGLVIGIIGRLIVPGTGGMSWVLTIVLGIVGALIGGYLAGAVFGETGGVDWIASIIVAALLVWAASRMGRSTVT